MVSISRVMHKRLSRITDRSEESKTERKEVMAMAKNLVGWMIFQILVGIWLLISPYVLGFRDSTRATADSMVFGAVVILIALGMSLFRRQVCGVEQPARKAS